MRQYSKCKAINDVVIKLLKDGWEVLRLNGGHPRIKSPDGKTTLTVPKTPSDWRTEKNWMSQARRAGAIA